MKQLILAFAVATTAFGTQAGMVSFNYGSPIVLSPSEINQTGSLGLFDSNLGTLTAARITVNGAATFLIQGTNFAEAARTASITGATNLAWDSSITALDAFLNDTIDLSATSGFQTYGAGQALVFGPLGDSDSLSDDLSTILASLQAAGGGQFSLTCESISGLLVQGGGGDIASDVTTNSGCGAEIAYTFDERGSPIPEPGSLALVGLALAASAAASRHRKA